MAKAKESASMSLSEIAEKLRAAGFQISQPRPNWVRVEAEGCGAVLEQDPQGVRFVEGPGCVIGGEIASLLDRGYQKYLQAGQVKVPALAEHLAAIHAFGLKVRAALDIPALYNESLGTVSRRYLYDRVAGRGDAPPQGVFGTNIRR